MSLKLNTDEARKADNFSSVIRDTGKYICNITRAQKLLSKNGTEGVGFSIRTDDGASATFLDVWTVNAAGKSLMGNGIVNAVLCCTRTKEAAEGPIEFDAWDNDLGRMARTTATGYPALMGKKVGLVLQRELSTYDGREQDRVVIAAVFEASTGFMASEILSGATKAEKLERIWSSISMSPVRDRREKTARLKPEPARASAESKSSTADDFDDDLPF